MRCPASLTSPGEIIVALYNKNKKVDNTTILTIIHAWGCSHSNIILG